MKGKKKKTQDSEEVKENDWEKRAEEMKPKQRSFLLLPNDWKELDRLYAKFLHETGIQKKWKFYRAIIKAGISNWKDIIDFAKTGK